VSPSSRHCLPVHTQSSPGPGGALITQTTTRLPVTPAMPRKATACPIAGCCGCWWRCCSTTSHARRGGDAKRPAVHIKGRTSVGALAGESLPRGVPALQQRRCADIRPRMEALFWGDMLGWLIALSWRANCTILQTMVRVLLYQGSKSSKHETGTSVHTSTLAGGAHSVIQPICPGEPVAAPAGDQFAC
jgi:hypothetical protein